jgi:prepilin-type N-terminal cleavage/methylation domain-containing protein/prepilin-type processing-associated H-X9-DG protein
MITKHQSRKAFTLLELLAVITIVGLLSSLAFVGGRKLVQKSRASQCMANLRNIGVGLISWTGERDGRLPAWETGRNSRDEDLPVMENELLDYVGGDERVFHCPADNKFFKESGCSYFWNTMLNNQNLTSVNLAGIITNHSSIPAVYDKESFHKDVGIEVNILYLDGHVSEDIRMVVNDE